MNSDGCGYDPVAKSLDQDIHDLPLYLICSDMLILLGEHLSGCGWGSTKLYSFRYIVF